jgi:hypothetical protein
MGKFRRKVIGVLKKVMGVNSSRSCGSSSTHHTALKKSPMHEEEETVPTEDEEEQEQEMEEGDDDPHLDLEGAQEMKAYNLVKDREFIHTPAFDPDLLGKICIDIEFTTIWRTLLPLMSKVLASWLFNSYALCKKLRVGLVFVFLRRNTFLHGRISALT